MVVVIILHVVVNMNSVGKLSSSFSFVRPSFSTTDDTFSHSFRLLYGFPNNRICLGPWSSHKGGYFNCEMKTATGSKEGMEITEVVNAKVVQFESEHEIARIKGIFLTRFN
jgi:hypothetical protein